MSADPFGTRHLRDAVLATWTAQPARFREDANAEEDHGRGYYRDRVVVELAQNAADAAERAGVPGRLLLRLTEHGTGGTLVAANLGSPLDAAGVGSLATLRASAKRAEPDVTSPGDRARPGALVGRFGVGFAAVRSVADEITVTSTTGSVHFSQARTTELLAGAGEPLTEEVRRREGVLPVLRLPFEGPSPHLEAVVPPGWDTVVALGLRDGAAVAEVRRQLRAVGDPLLLALPGLTAIEVEDGPDLRVVQDVAGRWVVATRSGRLDRELLADRPVEERERTAWQITWAVPVDSRSGRGSGLPGTVHAPTPTDEPSTLPALLLGTFPLDPSRRHVARGPLTDALVRHAGEAWADLMAACRDDDRAPAPLDLLPPGLPAGTLDAALRDAAGTAARGVPILTPVAGGPPLAGPEAVVLTGPSGEDAAALGGLARWMPHLVQLPPRHRHLVGVLGIGMSDLSEVVDALPHTSPAEHRALYDAFASADRGTLEELATLPVPLADGRTVRGARGLVLLDGRLGDVTDALADWGIRAVHPDAAHPLLERLGAAPADAASLLRHPAVRERVLDEHEDEPEHVAEVVLELVRAALDDGVTLDAAPWWGEILLPADDGDLVPARGLVLPGSPAARWYDPRILPVVDPVTADRWPDVLAAVGVRTGLTVVPVDLASGEDGSDDDAHLTTGALDGWDDYLDLLAQDGDVSAAPPGAAVADLDAVAAEHWPEVLRALARGDARRTLDRVRLHGTELPSYTAWWLRRRSGLGLDRPFAVGDAGPLARLLPPQPDVLEGLDREVLRALGGVVDPADLDAEGWADLLDALPAVGTPVAGPLAADVWRGLCALARGGALTGDGAFAGDGGLDDRPADLDADRLPALCATGPAMAAIEDVAVATPMWAQHPGVRPVMVVPAGSAEQVARVLDLDVAADREPGRVTSRGHELATPDAVTAVFPGAPATWLEHDDLRVDGERVDWWVQDGDHGPVLHAATTTGLALAVASVVGWSTRGDVARLLLDPSAVDDVAVLRSGEAVGP
ncbi:MAG: hypothetical protein JWP95_516 [Actinotalea sp.]|nr:hypothetical protein [Actinotalea sp.]